MPVAGSFLGNKGVHPTRVYCRSLTISAKEKYARIVKTTIEA
jgi:hypothetical protein